MKYKSFLTYAAICNCVARIALPSKNQIGYIPSKRILRLLNSATSEATVKNGYAQYPIPCESTYCSCDYAPDPVWVVADHAEKYHYNIGTDLDPSNGVILQIGPRKTFNLNSHLRLTLLNFEDGEYGRMAEFISRLHSSLDSGFSYYQSTVTFEKFEVSLQLKGLELSDLKIDYNLDENLGYGRVQHAQGMLQKTVGHEFGDFLRTADFEAPVDDDSRLIESHYDWHQNRALAIFNNHSDGDNLPTVEIKYVSDRPTSITELKAKNPFNHVRLFQRENDAAWVALSTWNPTRIWNQVLDKLLALAPIQAH